MTIYDVVVRVTATADYYRSTPGPLRAVVASFLSRDRAEALAARNNEIEQRRGVTYDVESNDELDLTARYRRS